MLANDLLIVLQYSTITTIRLFSKPYLGGRADIKLLPGTPNACTQSSWRNRNKAALIDGTVWNHTRHRLSLSLE